MTTTELHQLFKVEYDKVNVISAYPSFLPEEIDVWLNKATNMIISQKVTGNNARRIAFEGDIKRTADLQTLLKSVVIKPNSYTSYVNNAITFSLSTIADYLFYITSTIKFNENSIADVMLVTHEVAKKATETSINKPWLPRPVAVIEGTSITVYYDSYANKNFNDASLSMTYIKKPAIIDVYTKPTAIFELGDNVAYEMINCAILLALDNIESSRVTSAANLITIQE